MQQDQRARILLTRRWPHAVEAEMQTRFGATLNANDTPMSADTLAHAMTEYDVLCPTVGDPLPAGVLDVPGRRVRLIANYGVGVDHIDLDACRRLGIAVTNTPGVLTEATADLAITLMLMAMRRAGEGERELRAGEWTGWRPTHLVGTAPQGKVLGLIGWGRIARAMARKAHDAFGMEILFHARRPMTPEAGDPPAVQAASLDALLGAADVVSLHVPGGADTRHLIDAAALARMKQGAFLINTARGSVVDHAALAGALRSGHLGGAGLDVFPAEPAIPEGLADAPGAVLLPHLGSATRETREAMGRKALANVAAWLAGQDLPDRVA
ncbi:MAG TPA: D-glycerate dehydrogenase [Novosphingobium sp.]|nr:D-glycerate dehydrogenase [Novosphingobium sp.]